MIYCLNDFSVDDLIALAERDGREREDRMSDAVSLDFLGHVLRAIQTEQRNTRMESELIRAELGRLRAQFATRDDLLDIARALTSRISENETLMASGLDDVRASNSKVIALLEDLLARLPETKS